MTRGGRDRCPVYIKTPVSMSGTLVFLDILFLEFTSLPQLSSDRAHRMQAAGSLINSNRRHSLSLSLCIRSLITLVTLINARKAWTAPYKESFRYSAYLLTAMDNRSVLCLGHFMYSLVSPQSTRASAMPLLGMRTVVGRTTFLFLLPPRLSLFLATMTGTLDLLTM